MPPRKSAKSTAAAKDAEVDKKEEQKQTRRSTRSAKKEDPIEEEEDEEVETPKNKRGSAKKTAKETKAPAAKKGASKIAAKVAGKKGKKEESEDEEEESEEEKPKKGPAKRGRKSKEDEESEEEEEVKKPAAKSPAKRGRKSTKKKEESEEEEDDEESEEEVIKKPVTKRGGGRGSKTQEKEEEEDSKAKTTRGKRGARGTSQNKDAEEVEDEKEKKQQKSETGVSSTVVDSEVEINVGVKVFKKPGWIYDRYIEEEDNNDPNVKKFFKIQVLEGLYSKYPNHFYTYVRWGKIGEKGEWTLRGFFNKNRACQIYDEKIVEKMKYIKLNAAKKEKSAEASQTMQTETPAQSQSQAQPDSSQNNASTQDTTQQQNGAISQETPVTTEAPKTAIEEEKNGTTAAEEKKPEKSEEAQPMEVEKEGKKEEENNKMEEIKEEAAKIDKAKIDCPVDTHCPLASTTEVYIKDNEIFDNIYNASDVKKNTNHFYLFQILRNKKDPSKFYVFYRYGRTGLPGEWVLRGVFTEEQAVAAFRAKQEEKKVQNKYTALEMSYMKDDPELLTKLFAESASKSKLKKPVAEFIQLIFDFKMMNTQMEKAGYDPKKLPLGKLSLNTINQGFSALSELSDAIKNNADNETIEKLCNKFFTLIPQNVGWEKMSTQVIRTQEQIKEKLEQLESLRQIQAAYQMVHGSGEKIDEGANAIDENYEKLKCDIEPVDPSSEEYKKISNFIDNTKESYQVEIMEMFKINKHGSEESFRKDLDNHVMLWHGSRLTNFVGILSQGLRIAPPEAPVSGYRLGKGIYLADMISKSVPYCYASASNDTFCIMVCDAALGNINEKLHDDFYAGNLPADKHSTKALGHVAPSVSSYEDFEPGVKIPQGKPEKTEHSRSSFQHNEFIVYNVNQVQIRYLLKMKQKKSRGLFGF